LAEDEKDNQQKKQNYSMNFAYLDTNIFLYLSDKKSLFYKSCSKFLQLCQEKRILTATSTETIQEIIYYSQNTKQLEKGLKIANNVADLINHLLSVDAQTIKIYLNLIKKYKNIKSRDIIHTAVCIENNISLIISYDKELKKIEEIKTKTPKEFLEELQG